MSCLHISKETPTTNVYNALWLSVDKPNYKKKQTANQNSGNIAMRSQVKTSKLTKARDNAGDYVAIGDHWNLIGSENGASFLDQSQTKVKQTQTNSELLSISNQNLLQPPPPPPTAFCLVPRKVCR